MKNLLLTLSLCISTLASLAATGDVSVTLSGMSAKMTNGIVTINIGSNGRVSSMTKGSSGNLLASSGIYFDYTAASNVGLSPTKLEIVKQTADYAEVLYTNANSSPVMQQGYIMRKGDSGVYSYVIVKGNSTSSSTSIKEMRVCVRTASTLLGGYVDDRMNGTIPSNAEMKEAEKAENTVQDATYKLSDGSVYTKYNWAQYVVNDSVHGLMNANYGVWNIPCSHEWLNGGPMRQELTVHATSKSPITIQMLQGEHFGASAQTFLDGEEKIYGPFYIYVNQGTKEQMIADAKTQASKKQAEWPFQWFDNALYPLDRSTVSGQIHIATGERTDSIQVVLAEPDKDIYTQGKKYIFWTITDENGNFAIKNVRKGNYALYAYALAGNVTDEYAMKNITVDTENQDLGTIEWQPTHHNYTLWQIGQNNRRSDGFKYSDELRAYGWWEKVPANLTFTIGESKESDDWYYAQTKNGKWNVNFNVDDTYTGNLYLTASIAGASNKPKVAVALNNSTRTTWSTWNDAAIYRSALLGGTHKLMKLTIPASLLKKGANTLTFTMSGISKNGGVMWDCIKLEADTKSATGIEDIEPTEKDKSVDLYNLNGTFVGRFDSIENIQGVKGVYIYRQGCKTGKIFF